MGQREDTRVIAWRADSNDDSLQDLASSALAAIANVPAEYRDKVQLEWDHSDYSCRVEAYYIRPETDAEIVERETRSARYQAERDERDRREYERLCAKYAK